MMVITIHNFTKYNPPPHTRTKKKQSIFLGLFCQPVFSTLLLYRFELGRENIMA